MVRREASLDRVPDGAEPRVADASDPAVVTELADGQRLLVGATRPAVPVGGDDLVVDADGASAIFMEDLAVALIDEAERPRHHRTRFTAAY